MWWQQCRCLLIKLFQHWIRTEFLSFLCCSSALSFNFSLAALYKSIKGMLSTFAVATLMSSRLLPCNSFADWEAWAYTMKGYSLKTRRLQCIKKKKYYKWESHLHFKQFTPNRCHKVDDTILGSRKLHIVNEQAKQDEVWKQGCEIHNLCGTRREKQNFIKAFQW